MAHNANRPCRNNGFEFRTRDMAHNTELTMGDPREISRIIAYVKTGSRNQRDLFRKAVNILGLDAQFIPNGIVSEIEQPLTYANVNSTRADGMVTVSVGHVAAFDIAAPKRALLALVASGIVDTWHYAHNARVSQIAVGSGAEKKIAPRFTAREVADIVAVDLLGLDDERRTLPVDQSSIKRPKRDAGAPTQGAIQLRGEAADEYIIGR